MKPNRNKCHLITNKQSCMNLKIGRNVNIDNSTCEKQVTVTVIINSTSMKLDGITKKSSC